MDPYNSILLFDKFIGKYCCLLVYKICLVYDICYKWSLFNVEIFVTGLYQFPTATNATSLENLYSDNCTNISCNLTKDNYTNETYLEEIDGEPLADLILMVLLSIVLGLMILVTVIGK